jgi:hypothetical protein
LEPASNAELDLSAHAAPAGVMYSAVGERYVQEALLSARSSLRHNRLPHLLFSSEPVANPPEGLAVVRFEPVSTAPFVDRIANMRRSPFGRTIYLDGDTYVVDEIVHVLELLDHYELALARSPSYRGLADPEVPKAFYEFNCGVLAWRASDRVADFLRSWEETYRAWLEQDVLTGPLGDPTPTRSGMGDQPAFRRCAWQHGMSIFVLAPEYNLRVGRLTTVVDRVRVIHGRYDDYEKLAARMNRKLVPRTFPRSRPIRRLRRRVRGRLRRSMRVGTLARLMRRAGLRRATDPR